jgi:hypothetical protein
MNRPICNLLLGLTLTGLTASAAWADPTTATRVHAVLKGSTKGVAFGQAWHRGEIFDASHFRDHFRVYLRVKRKNADPSLDPDAVKSAELAATLSRNGTAYAECILTAIVDRDPDFIPDARRLLDFGVAVTNLGGDVKAPKGTCDTDLSSAFVQRGVPDVQAGDEVSVRLVGGPGDGQVLATGSFEAQ